MGGCFDFVGFMLVCWRLLMLVGGVDLTLVLSLGVICWWFGLVVGCVCSSWVVLLVVLGGCCWELVFGCIGFCDLFGWFCALRFVVCFDLSCVGVLFWCVYVC